MQQQMVSVIIRMAMQRHRTKPCSRAHTANGHAAAQDQAVLTSRPCSGTGPSRAHERTQRQKHQAAPHL
jgi:hypothetical protein